MSKNSIGDSINSVVGFNPTDILNFDFTQTIFHQIFLGAFIIFVGLIIFLVVNAFVYTCCCQRPKPIEKKKRSSPKPEPVNTDLIKMEKNK